MKRIYLVILLLTVLLPNMFGQVGQREIKPTIDYNRTPRTYYIGNITVDGVKNYDDYLLIGLSGLTVGQPITIPGEEITKAIKRFWRNGLFSNVAISVDSLVNDSAYLHIQLAQRPRISEINYNGIKKGERDDLQEKLGLIKDNQVTPNMLDRAKLLCKRYFDEKGFKNAEVSIMQRDDAAHPDKVILDVNVDKKDKVKIHRIIIAGNQNLKTSKIKGNLIKSGVLKKIHDKKSMAGWFRSKKFTDAKYKEAKENLMEIVEYLHDRITHKRALTELSPEELENVLNETLREEVLPSAPVDALIERRYAHARTEVMTTMKKEHDPASDDDDQDVAQRVETEKGGDAR